MIWFFEILIFLATVFQFLHIHHIRDKMHPSKKLFRTTSADWEYFHKILLIKKYKTGQEDMNLGNSQRCYQLEKDDTYSRHFISIWWDVLILYCHLLENHCNKYKNLHCLQYDWNSLTHGWPCAVNNLPNCVWWPWDFLVFPFTPSFYILTSLKNLWAIICTMKNTKERTLKIYISRP